MRLRQIELQDVRRFTGQSAVLSGIPDGISVVSEPNEFGKSTFFDAVHALFFEPATSMGKTVKRLQPHAGGAPFVAVDIEFSDGLFRVEKRWIKGKTARVTQLPSGRIVAQGDEAEDWLSKRMGRGEGGPTGLLWVRQGALSVDPEETSVGAKRLGEALKSTRRSLVTAVSADLDALTGGRRMERVEAQLAERLGGLITSRGVAKAGSEWHRLESELKVLEERRAELSSKISALQQHLEARKTAEAQLKRLNDPSEAEHRQADLAEAEAALQIAQDHAQRLEHLAQTVTLAQLHLKEAEAQDRSLQDLALRAQTLAQQWQGAEAEDQAARAFREALQLRLEAARVQERAALSAREAAEQAEREGRSAQLLALQAAQRSALVQSLKSAEAQIAQIKDLRQALAAITVTRADEAAVQQDIAALEALRQEAAVSSVRLRFKGEGLEGVRLDGVAVSQSEHRLLGPSMVQFGAATLEIIPPDSRAALIPQLEQALLARLAQLKVENLPELRALLEQSDALKLRIAGAEAALVSLVPQGIEALRLEIAALPEAPLQPIIDIAALEAAHRLAKEHAQHIQEAAQEAQLALSRADVEQVARKARLADLAAERDILALRMGPSEAFAAQLHSQKRAVAQALSEYDQAQTALALAKAEAPDFNLAQIRVARLKAAAEDINAQRLTLERNWHGHNSVIAHAADEGLEELHGEVEGRIEAIRRRIAAYAREAAVLKRVEQAVQAARSDARDTYLAPVLQELKPFLHVLGPEGTDVVIDEESLLPVEIVRAGQSEAVDVLSGGTREQLAVLTRFAFARLLARSGEDVPVILDDALVHSDDARISRMFDILHDLARDRQVLVLTCRQRAFTDLGAQRRFVEITEL